ncbi:hypothetical protein POPTR_005G062700v4 [Populus trichocarpa]|uniref:ADP-ribosyl cyclase/cyclic ADP-ribose hydrolase n=2 Tax=Populus trichocarpa TaxID=3694 RepID=A0A3N7EWE6_POPTR|nr:disease resistance protein RPV1 [Populus trichocarpa]XP_006382862.2 disease resistance protein RPV1 [Populus trichocarpa]KAI5587677.1 hypothetical protein BDE02_05G050000 [Populus trichocarpa]RQO90094.1 hypothetical protein POPTR_005G062700v4 [Populus trichocarpa]RQO90095.1 hypothetical protein POPTR_005G062700v4 [Populus trichocarpa]RQO90096.1 hypothetical protein POPTR_005G062700v4 [Populus trichocarpa]RQO90097.1 hypothetical protein POPTR_005G062700v4 [Populus trichocarpa]|eukprot:XP_002306243.2 TMV resistance protein N [Populus trichocarpa]
MASSSSAVTPLWKYDVFLSFRGADVRHNFLRHLYDALDQNEIETFIDYKLGAGEEISRILLEKIEQSNVSIVIFSKNYADSPWCLEELEKILECRQTLQQIVIPVFYHVDPTHVRELSNSYGNALSEHQKKISSDKVDNWKRVLIEIADLEGWHFNDTKKESELVQEIVDYIRKELKPLSSSNFGNLVEIGSCIGKVDDNEYFM